MPQSSPKTSQGGTTLTARFLNVTRSLRFRLMLLNALVVLLASLGTLVGLRAGIRYSLLHELDQILNEDLNELELALAVATEANASELWEQLERKAQGHIQHQWFVQLEPVTIDEHIGSVSASAVVTQQDVNSNFRWRSSNAPSTLDPDRVGANFPATIENYRIHSRTCNASSGIPVRLCIGASLNLIDRDLALIDKIIGVAIALGLIVAPLGGFVLAGVATKPLISIIRTADRLRPEKLDERLPIRGRGDELDQLSHSFNRMLDRIAVFLQGNSDFLANAAHELRTPLAAMRSTAEVALQSERTAKEYQELLETIVDEGESLELLVNQLLLLAEVETRHDRLETHGETVDLRKLVEKACEMFEGVAESRSLSLRCRTTPGVYVNGNCLHIRQVLNNLIDNAIKFTAVGGNVEVTLGYDPDRNFARVAVRDDGVGISIEDQNRLFERFFRSERSHRRDTETRGTGLGLSICESVAKSHGGSIEVTSELGVGSEFVLVLPACS